MNNLPRLVENALDSLKSSFSLRSHLPSSAPDYLEENREHFEKFNHLQGVRKLKESENQNHQNSGVSDNQTIRLPRSGKLRLSDNPNSPTHWLTEFSDPPKFLIPLKFFDSLGNLICVIIPESVKSVVLGSLFARRRELKFAITSGASNKVLRRTQVLITAASLAALFALAVIGHSFGFTRLANPSKMRAKEKLQSVLGVSSESPNELILSKNLGLGGVQVEDPERSRRVLQATTPSGVTRNIVININAPTNIKGVLTVNGDTVITGSLTAPNLINQLVEGDNIEITNATGPNPTISVDLPDTLVYSLQGKTGDLKFSAGTGITVSGLKISSSLTLDQSRTIGGCTGCITTTDLAALTIAKGGTGLTSYTTGDIIYADSTSTLAKLGIGSETAVLTTSEGIPAWAISIEGGLVTADSLDFLELKNSLTLDANTSVALSTYGLTFTNNGTSNFVVNLSSTGDFVLQDNGTPFVTFADDGSTTVAGASTVAGLLTGTAGSTVSGGTISLNASSNNATNINTGTSTGATTLGGGSGTVEVASTSWDISTLGAATGLTGITSSGTVIFSAISTGVITNTNGTLSSSASLLISLGGTGVTTYATGDLLYYNSAASTTALQKLTVGASGAVLIETGGIIGWSTGVDGAFITDDSIDFTQLKNALTLDADTSVAFLDGINNRSLTVTNDGTANFVINLSSTGDFVIQNNGAGNEFLTFSDSGAITLNGQGTGVLYSTSGTLTGGAAPLAYGGTAASLTAAAGGIVYSGASALALTAAGTSGQCLSSAGTGTPTWGACGFTAASQTDNQIVKFGSSTTFANSSMNDNATTIAIAANAGLALASGTGTFTQAYSGTGTAYTITTSGSGSTGIALNDTNTSVVNPLLVIQSGSNTRYSINDAGQVTLSPSSTTPIANISNSLTPISAGTTGSYATLTNLPDSRSAHGTVAYNGYLFVIGGHNASSYYSTVYSAQIKSDGTIGSWATLSTLPAALRYHGTVAYNGYLFVIGGYTNTQVSTVYSTQIKADGTIGAWQTLSNLPTTLYDHGTAAYNGYLFITGGYTGVSFLSTVYSAQIKSDGTIGSWATLSTLPATRYQHATVAYNGYLFVTGGNNVATVYSAAIKSDGTIGSWATLSTLPAARYDHGTAAYNGYLFVTGGSTTSTVYSSQVNADGTIGSWATLSTLPTTRYDHGTAAYNGYLFVTGGTYAGYSSTVYSAPLQSTALAQNASTSFATGNLFDLWNDEVSKFSVDYSGLVSTNAGISFSNISNKPTANLISSVDPLGTGATGAYSTLANLPATRYAHSSVAYNGYLFVTGGTDGATASTVYSAQIKADGTIGSWATLTNLPAARWLHSSVAYNGYLFVTGGNAGAAVSTVYSAQIKADGTIGSWATLTNLPAARERLSSVAYNGYLFVTGGGGPVSTVYSAQIKADGTIGSWATLTNLPAAREDHSSVAYNGYLFVTGGGGPVSTVYSAPIKSDGTIGSFATLTNLPTTRQDHSSVVYNGYLFVTGGYSGAAVSTVYSAQIKADGTIGSFATLTNLPATRYYHSSVVYNGYLFVTGGYNGSAVVSTVYSAPLQSTALAANTTNQFNSGNLLDLWNFNTSKFAVDYSGLVKTQAGIEFSNSRLQSAPVANLISATDPLGTGGTGAYSTLANLPATRYDHSSVAYNGYLFVTGGYSGATVSTVYSAQIKADGTIGSFATLTNLPATRERHSSVAYNGYLFVTGGNNGTAAVSTVYSAKINADGTIGSFATLTNLPATRERHSSVAYNGYLFVTGGNNVSTVYSAPINSDGTIGSFATLTNLPATRYYHSSVVYNGYLFVTGGYNGTAVVSTVYSAQIKADGTIGAWATLTNLPATRYGHSSVAYNGYLFVTGGETVSTVYSAPINSDGTIGSFATLTALPATRWIHSSVAYNGYLFVTGGYNANCTGNVCSTVYSTPLQSTAFALNTTNTFSAGNLLDIWNNNTSKFSIDYDGNVQTQGSFVSNVTQQLDGLTGSYSTLSNLPAVNTQGGVVTYNGYMYIVGGATGNDATPVNTIYSTPIRNDGTISATFNTLNTLPATTMRLGALAANGYLYSLGGHNGTNSITTVSYAQLKPDGTIGTVGSTTALPLLRSRHAPTEAGGYIFVLGGNNDTAAVAKVYSSQVKTDGTLAAWATLTDLPAASQSLAAASWGGYLFVSGGYDGTTNRLSTVYSAPVLSDGTIGAWSTLTSLPALREQHKMVAYNGYLYVVGGSADGSTALSTVYSAPIKSDGTIGSWATLTALPAVRYQQGVALYNGYVFVVGGNSGAAAVSTVYSASLTTSRAFVFNSLNSFSTPLGGSSSLFTLQNNGDARFNVDAQGNGRFSGNIYAAGAILGTPGAVGDLAENIEASDTSIEAGDVVSICSSSPNLPNTPNLPNCKPGTLVKSSTAYDSTVLGVVSTQASLTFSPQTENGRPVALAGRVPVKVSTENGPIAAGDYLTASSQPGVAMKMTSLGQSVGVALEPFSGTQGDALQGYGKVLVFVNSTFVDPTKSLFALEGADAPSVTSSESPLDSSNSDTTILELAINSLEEKIKELEDRISGFPPSAGGLVSSAPTPEREMNFATTTNETNLSALTVLGTSSFSNLTASSLSVGGLTIREMNFANTGSNSRDFESAPTIEFNSLGILSMNNVEINQLGDMKVLGSLTIDGSLEAKVLGTDKSAGTVTIPRGETERELKFATTLGSNSGIYSAPQIILTPVGKATNVGVQTNSDNFKLILPAPLKEDLEIQYLIVN